MPGLFSNRKGVESSAAPVTASSPLQPSTAVSAPTKPNTSSKQEKKAGDSIRFSIADASGAASDGSTDSSDIQSGPIRLRHRVSAGKWADKSMESPIRNRGRKPTAEGDEIHIQMTREGAERHISSRASNADSFSPSNIPLTPTDRPDTGLSAKQAKLLGLDSNVAPAAPEQNSPRRDRGERHSREESDSAKTPRSSGNFNRLGIRTSKGSFNGVSPTEDPTRPSVEYISPTSIAPSRRRAPSASSSASLLNNASSTARSTAGADRLATLTPWNEAPNGDRDPMSQLGPENFVSTGMVATRPWSSEESKNLPSLPGIAKSEGRTRSIIGKNIDEQAQAGKQPSADISPFLFQAEEFPDSTPDKVARQRSFASQGSISHGKPDKSGRGSRSTISGRQPSGIDESSGDMPIRKKKSSLFGLLKKKASRGDIHAEESGDIPMMPGALKSKSRTTSHDGTVDTDGGKRPRMKKLNNKDKEKPRTERDLVPLGKFGLDEGISLDTNLDSMEGIVNMDSLSLQRRGSSTSGASVLTIPREGNNSPPDNRAIAPNFSAPNFSRPDGRPSFADPFNPGRTLTAGPPNARFNATSRRLSTSFPGDADGPKAFPAGAAPSRKGSLVQFSGNSQTLGPSSFTNGRSDLRRGSYISVHSASSASGTECVIPGRRPSLAGAGVALLQQQQQPKVITKQPSLTHVGPAPLPSVPILGIGSSSNAGWIAPESWAVKPETGSDSATDSDVEDSDDHPIPGDEMESLKSRPDPTNQNSGLDKIEERNVRALDGRRKGSDAGLSSAVLDGPDVSKALVQPKRPIGTGTKVTQADMSKMWTIRVYRSDMTFVTLMCPLLASATDVHSQLSKKLYNGKAPSSLQIFIRERSLERAVTGTDKPIIIQRRRLEQAGYGDSDRLEDVGRQDFSYLVRFLFRDAALTTSVVDPGEFDGYEHVNLQARSLQAIPIFLFKHASNMVGLNLSRNPKLDLPSDFVALCIHLRELRLCYMAMKRVPQSICKCPSLTYLDLSNNRLADLDHANLDQLQMLTDLKAHNNRLWTLPAQFASMSCLRFLNISNNKFETFPDVICEISALADLDVSFNMITSLPADIGKLKRLERFVMLANPIAVLPPSFGGLVKLSELDCRRCLLADIAIFSTLPELKILHCDSNNATVLDGIFNNLRELSASRNSITRLLLAGTNSTLVTLNVSHAKISSLGQEFFDALGACETLVLDNNQIKSFADNFVQLSNLRKMSVRNNHLTSLPDSIGSLQRLHTLDLANNSLATLPSSIWSCAQLIVLNVTSNLLSSFPMPVASEATTVDDTGRKMSVWTKNTARAVPPLADSLQELFAGDNRLGDDVFSPLSLLNELRVLNLSFNELYEIPPVTLSKCESLEELYLSGNGLSSLPGEDFERLINLKTLFVNGNKLQTIPAELGKIKPLEGLDVSCNSLKYNVTNWPYDWNWNWNLELQYLNFSGNKRLEIKTAPMNKEDRDAVAVAKRRNLSTFNALRKLRVLGLMDVTSAPSSIPDESEERRVRTTMSQINSMSYGISDSLGREDHNVVAIDLVHPRFRGKEDEAIFGLFDAHSKFPFGGSKLAKALQDAFVPSLSIELRRLRDGEGVHDALRRTFLNVNRDYGNSVSHLFDVRRKNSDASSILLGKSNQGQVDIRCGASAVILFVQKKTVHVANVGDALAVLAGRGGTAKALSSKHDPFDEDEIAHIRMAEGWVSQKGLIADDVEVSRSFGYYHLHPAINAVPSIQSVELTEDDEFIILANASLWAHMTYQAAVDVARDVFRDAGLSATGDPYMQAALKLRDLALSYGAESNIMVMVVGVGDLFKAKTHPTYRGAGGALIDEDAFGATRVAARRGLITDAPAEKYLTLLDREVAPPTGMVALVFTDIRSSTSLWENNGGMQSAMRMHNQLFRRQLRGIGGYEVKTEGDAFMVSFPSVTSALLFCLTVQLELLREDWPQDILESEDGKEIIDSTGEVIYRGLSVRMGIHWGSPHCEADPITRRMDYFGPMVNRSARISAEAKGGEISASLDVVEIIKKLCFDPDDEPEGSEESEALLDPVIRRDVSAIRKIGFGIFEIGERKLKGLETPDFLSLIYPRALAGRLNIYGASLGGADGQVDEVYEAVPKILDSNEIRQLAVVVLRLETLLVSVGKETQTPLLQSTDVASAERKSRVHPHLLSYPVRPDASDEELGAVLENLIGRLENVSLGMQIRTLGPLSDILAIISNAIKVDPGAILPALRALGVSPC